MTSTSWRWAHFVSIVLLLVAAPSLRAAEPEPLYDEKYRPQFHFTAREHWLNDPNGLVFYKGDYHLFFQHNPKGNQWGNMTWGHAISPDLVHWRQVNNALEPDALGAMFSGSAVVDWTNTAGFQKGDEKALVAIYTAAGAKSSQCIAYSNDRGATWTKYEHNPVLPHIIGGNRDPKVVWHAPTHRWIMALYLDKNDYGFFDSPDLKTWTHLHDITVPGCSECPDFFPMQVEGDKPTQKWVWTAANGKYLVGAFDGKRFTPDDADAAPRQVDFGQNFYAVQTYSDVPATDGRRIQIAWMRGGKYPGMPFNQQMSFPCELTLRAATDHTLRLCRMPVREIERLYGLEHKHTNMPLKAGEDALSEITGDLFDISAIIEPGSATEVQFIANGATISYDVKEKRLTSAGATVTLEPRDGRIALRILVDRTSIETFGNDGEVSLTSCILPKDDHALHLVARGGDARIPSMEVHVLKSAWH